MTPIPDSVGPYQIIAPLGEGGMGRVFRAHDPRLNRDVAVKLLPPEFSSDPARRARFEQEARAVAALNHPGIVSVYDVGDGWMVTEFIEGRSLRGAELTLRQIIDAGAQIAEALAAAHEAGITHRDIKPDNILLTKDGRTKILDFGLAKAPEPAPASLRPDEIRTVTNPGAASGTPGYMAPEQVRGQATDTRSDIFSLGVVLYELLAGKPAFEGPSAVEVMHAIVHQDPAELPDTVPTGVRRIVRRCLEKQPSQRFQSARDLAFALRALSGPMAAAAAPRRIAVVWPALSGAALLVAAVSAWVALTRPRPADLSNYRFQPFAFTRDQEHSGVWSPDGDSIAFVQQTPQGTRLMVQSLDAAAPTQLAEPVSNQPGQLAWSPDGTRIYFLAQGAVNAVSRAGGQPERLMGGVAAFHLSRDGQALAVWRAAPNSDPEGARRSVWISSPPGAEPVEYQPAPFAVVTPFQPVHLRFSPDGRLLYLSLYTDSGAETWLLPYPPGSGQPRRIFANVPWNRPVAASWMPDSRRLVLSGNPAPAVGEQLWLADITDETLRRIMASPEGGQATPSVSPDGRRIAFARVVRDRDIVELPLDGSPPRTLLATSLPEMAPAWSPSGDQFAYVTRRNGVEELWVRSAEGNWDRPVVTPREFPTIEALIGPVFSPDGGRIAYTALLAGSTRRRSLAISPAGGGTPTIVSDGYAPTFSPDGARLAFLWLKPDGTIPVATLRLGSDQSPTEIVSAPGLNAPEWSPSGEWIAAPSVRGIELVSPDGGNARLLRGINAGAIAWSRDSATIYALGYQGAQPPTLSAVDARTGAVRKLGEYNFSVQPLLENTYSGSIRLSLAPDGARVATAIATSQSDIWILDGFR
jgi:serine/threonine protein kinase/Tol biopolymer transport system component